jgi:hypothetical protein
VKRQIATTLLQLSFAAFMAGAQSTAGKAPQPAPQVRDYWIDPATNLMWATKDNGKDISWKAAIKYCRDLNLAGYTGWRMPNMDELQALYDKNIESPGLMGAKRYHNVSPSAWHIKGNIFLSGDQWTTLRRLDDRGKPSGYVYFYDFNEGRSDNDPTGWPYSFDGMRVLCVRGPQAFPVKPSIN